MYSEDRRKGLAAEGHCCLPDEETRPVDSSFLIRLKHLFTLQSVFWVYAHQVAPMEDFCSFISGSKSHGSQL